MAAKNDRTPVWKVLLVGLFGAASLGLALATLIVPLAVGEGQERWLWLAGLLGATAVTASLFFLFLKHADQGFKR